MSVGFDRPVFVRCLRSLSLPVKGAASHLFSDECWEKEVQDALEEVREIKEREGKPGGAG